MTEELRSVLLGTTGLSVAAVTALLLTIARGHIAEEYATSFQQRFPEVLGLAPWSSRFFVSFNFLWLALWALGAWGLTVRQRAALFPLWFLGIAGVANGLAHPLLSARAGG